MKKPANLRWMIPFAIGALFLSGCKISATPSASSTTIDPSSGGSSTSESNTSANYTSPSTSVVSTSYTPSEGTVAIVLSDGASTCSSNAVTIDNTKNRITISSVCTYSLSGSLSNGSIIITAEETTSEDTVELDLNGVSITSKGTNSLAVTTTSGTVTMYPGPIYSENSAHLEIKAVSGSANVITDSRATSLEAGDDNAAIFSNKLLKFKGSGSLNVVSTFNNGVGSDSKVKASKLTLGVSAPNDAVKAHNAVILGGAEDLGSFTFASTGSDGIAIRVDEVDASVTTPVYGNSESNDDIAGIEIKDAAYALSAKGNVVSSEAYLYLVGGNGSLVSSAGKGFRAANNIFINGGDFTVKTPTDDCIHSSSGSVTCGGGTYVLTSGTASGCQGIKGETSVIINGGSFTITSSYEGIAAHKITVTGGMTSVVSSDDGWSAGGTSEQTSSACAVVISGGFNYVYAGGDGIDSNGSFAISGGTTVVAAPSSGGNGPLDSGDNYAITVTGGNVIAYGVTGMTESLSGTENSVVLYSHTSISQGTYYVFTQGGTTWALKTSRQSSTLVLALDAFSSGAVAVYSASNVTVSETLFAAGSFYKASAYTASSTLYSGSFSSANSSHLTSGSSQGGGGGGGGRPGF